MPRRKNALVIPGVKIKGKIEGNQYRLRREADEFFINNRRTKGGDIGVQGSTTHIHIHGRKKRQKVPLRDIDLQGRKDTIRKLIEERAKQIEKMLKMPLSEKEIAKKTAAFEKKTHPIRSAFKIGSKVRWNPLALKETWYWHPVIVASQLLPFELVMGVGRHSKRRQVRSYKENLESRARAFAEAEAERKAIGALDAYRRKFAEALAELEITQNTGAFEKKATAAEKEFTGRTQILILEYAQRTGRKNINRIEGLRPAA